MKFFKKAHYEITSGQMTEKQALEMADRYVVEEAQRKLDKAGFKNYFFCFSTYPDTNLPAIYCRNPEVDPSGDAEEVYYLLHVDFLTFRKVSVEGSISIDKGMISILKMSSTYDSKKKLDAYKRKIQCCEIYLGALNAFLENRGYCRKFNLWTW